MTNTPTDPYLAHHWRLIDTSKNTDELRVRVGAFERFWFTYDYGRYAPESVWQDLEELVRTGPHTRILEERGYK